jgi:hypothetical protein
VQSVKAALNCIGTGGGTRSVLGDLFGFFLRRVPTDPDTSVTARVSLTAHLQGLSGRHLHINVIGVGLDSLSAADQQTALEKIDYGIYRTRNIYQTVNLGIGRVQHWEITTAASGGRDDLGSEDEADDLTDEWTVQNNGIDVFVVRTISDADFVGTSPVPGDCDKDDKDDGLIGGEVNRDHEPFSRTFAHEIGHFLNLSHNHGADPACPTTTPGQNNLMAQTRCALSTRDSVLLTSGQGSTVRGRCQVRAGC